jgi:hypothetical protein
VGEYPKEWIHMSTPESNRMDNDEIEDLDVIIVGAGTAAYLTVFQRTPNLALPMRQTKLDDDTIRRMKERYPEIYDGRTKTFGGSDIDFLAKAAFEVSDDERQAIFERLWEMGGFVPWIGSFNDVFVNEEADPPINSGATKHGRGSMIPPLPRYSRPRSRFIPTALSGHLSNRIFMRSSISTM